MEDVPIPDSASRQNLISTVEVASQAFLLTLATLEVLVWLKLDLREQRILEVRQMRPLRKYVL
jgi:alpha-D-ribose 1-methylphosphonate 5-triphosphate synthase subunit PhnH